MPDLKIVTSPVEINPSDPFGTDLLRLREFADGLSNLVRTIKHPLVIAFDGPWGSGKSTFLRQWKAKLEEEDPDFPVILFDAFENDYVDDAFAALTREIIVIIEEKKGSELEGFKEKAIACGSVLLRSGAKLVAKAGIRLITANTLRDEDLQQLKSDIEAESESAAGQFFESLLNKPNEQKKIFEDFRMTLSKMPELLNKNPQRTASLIFIIDELDRCRPAFALSILERIKHFMSVPNVHFVLGVHLEQLKNSVRAEYGDGIDAHLYLQKFINLTVSMPSSEDFPPGRYESYFDHLASTLTNNTPQTKIIFETKSYLVSISRVNRFSLRSMERIFSTVILYALFSNENQLRMPFLIAALCSLKVMAPNLYEKARDGNLSYKEMAQFVGLAGGGKDSSEIWQIGWWHYLLDQEMPSDTPDHKSIVLKYRYEDRREIVPSIVSQIDKLK
jgi:hypothetical protein